MSKYVLGLFSVIGIIGITTASIGCGDDSGTNAVDCSTVKGFSELGGAFAKCTACHSTTLTSPTDRQAAPVGYDYDTYEAAKKFPEAITEQVEDDEMPFDPSPKLTAQEKTDMLTWAACETPP
ncbi:MAG: hypothetical protein JNK04_17620 [Myxococcales bacterium]|nr:hypothetical protein [Myxococcales bacterium]